MTALGQRATQLIKSPTARFSLGRVIPAALTVISTPILARLIDRHEFGELALLQTVALLAGAALFGWTEVLIVRLFSSQGSIREEELSALGRPALSGVALVCVVGLMVSAASGSVLPLLTALCAVSFALTLMSTALARAGGDSFLFVTAASIGLGARFLLGLPLIALGAGIWAILGMWVVGGVAAVVWAARRLGLRWSNFSLPPVRREHVAFAAPIVAVSTGLLILALADRLILSLFVSSAELAPYALGYSLVDQAASLAFSVLMATQFPAMVRTYDTEGTAAAAIQLQTAISRFARLTVPPILMLGLYGGKIAALFGGAQYENADFRFMPCVAFGLFLNGLHQYLAVPSQQRHKTRNWAAALTLGVVVNVALNFVLIPASGTLGAGIATAVGYAVVVASLLVTERSVVRLPTAALVRQAVAVLAAIVVAALANGLAWPAAAVLAGSAYLVLALAPVRSNRPSAPERVA